MEHKCIECGYLTIRILGYLKEVSRDGDILLSDPSKRLGISDAPICFVRACNLPVEYQEATNMGVPSMVDPRINIVLRKERKCDSFTKWQQGFTPKEHREMLDRQEWRNWQERQRKEERHWRIIELIVLGFIAVVVAGGFTILGAFIERGSLFPLTP